MHMRERELGYLGELWHLKHDARTCFALVSNWDKREVVYVVYRELRTFVSKTENPTETVAQNSEISLKLSQSRNLKSYIFMNKNIYFNKLSAD